MPPARPPHTRCTHRGARSCLPCTAIRRARIDVVFNWLDTQSAVRRRHAPSLRNANAGARHDSTEVDLLAKLEDADLAAAARRELEAVVAHDRAMRVVKLDTERLARARVGHHCSVVDVLERNAGLAPFAAVPVDQRADRLEAEREPRGIDDVYAVRVRRHRRLALV